MIGASELSSVLSFNSFPCWMIICFRSIIQQCEFPNVGVTELLLSNGMKVCYRCTDFLDDQVLIYSIVITSILFLLVYQNNLRFIELINNIFMDLSEL